MRPRRARAGRRSSPNPTAQAPINSRFWIHLTLVCYAGRSGNVYGAPTVCQALCFILQEVKVGGACVFSWSCTCTSVSCGWEQRPYLEAPSMTSAWRCPPAHHGTEPPTEDCYSCLINRETEAPEEAQIPPLPPNMADKSQDGNLDSSSHTVFPSLHAQPWGLEEKHSNLLIPKEPLS